MKVTRFGWMAAIAFVGFLQATTAQTGRGRGGQSPPPAPQARQPNTCKCEPPVPAEASGIGACSRTQDDGTYCDLNFVSAGVTAGIAATPGFATFASRMKLPAVAPDDLARAAGRIQNNQVAGLEPPEIATFVRAVAAIAAYARRNDSSAFRHFTDIFALTDPAMLTPLVADAMRLYAVPATTDNGSVKRAQT